MGWLQIAQLPLLASAGRRENLVYGPWLIAKSEVKCVAHYRENRIVNGDLGRCGEGKPQSQEVAVGPQPNSSLVVSEKPRL